MFNPKHLGEKPMNHNVYKLPRQVSERYYKADTIEFSFNKEQGTIDITYRKWEGYPTKGYVVWRDRWGVVNGKLEIIKTFEAKYIPMKKSKIEYSEHYEIPEEQNGAPPLKISFRGNGVVEDV